MTTFQERLNEALSMRDMKPSELSRLSGVNEGAISQYRKGAYKANQYNLEKMAKVLNVSIPWLMGADEPVQEKIQLPKQITPATYRKFKVIGNIACGNPIEAIENASECEYVETNLNIHADYVLRAQGDSMINARIFNGDFVFIREQPEVENGEIAAVLMDGEVTLKRFYRYDEYIELRAENPMYKPIIIHESDFDTIKVIGKAVACQFFVI